MDRPYNVGVIDKQLTYSLSYVQIVSIKVKGKFPWLQLTNIHLEFGKNDMIDVSVEVKT